MQRTEGELPGPQVATLKAVGGGLHLLMANDVAPVVDFDHGDLVFLIHHRDRHW
jgi:hypothetical protein